MVKSDKLYRFRSKSQHMLIVSNLGRKQKIKFSTPYGGVSRYNTSNEIIARQIRQSQAYKSGMIVEDEAVEHGFAAAKPETTDSGQRTTDAEEQAAGTAAVKTPEFLKKSVKVSANVNVNDNVNDNVNVNDNAALPPETEAEDEQTADNGQQTAEGEKAKVVQDELFKMTLEDVENYMDAKQYVNDVLHAGLTRKEEVKAYCEEHNVKFPNFSFD